jgi:hypothetical protein
MHIRHTTTLAVPVQSHEIGEMLFEGADSEVADALSVWADGMLHSISEDDRFMRCRGIHRGLSESARRVLFQMMTGHDMEGPA